MTLLPGQVNKNGVSNFLFGTNLGQSVAQQTVFNTSSIQQQIKNAGFAVMRIGNMAGKSNAFIDASIAAVQACGCAALIVLDLTNLSANQAVVSYVGNRCSLYEVGNEPNGAVGGNLTGTQYYTTCWSPQVASLRALAPAGAFFIGPAITKAGLSGSFITDWLTLCQANNLLPDAVSFHDYPGTGFQDQNNVPQPTVYSTDYTTIDGQVNGVLGHSLPVCLTEWNISSANNQPAFTTQPSFVTSWVHGAIDAMVSSGYALCCQFEAGTGEGHGSLDLIQTGYPGFPPGADYQPIVDKYLQYMSGNFIGCLCHA